MTKFANLVEKATSDLLNDPDLAVNLEICDLLNLNPLHAKDVIKTLKRRLGNRNSKVQLLALMLLEMLVSNCGEHVHCQVLEANILQEMIKIAPKATDFKVQYKVLMLIQSWKEAFSVPGGKFPQFSWAYNELNRSGLKFPQPSEHSVPVFTPPPMRVPALNPQYVYGVPRQGPKQSNEIGMSGPKIRSLADMKSAWHVMSLLDEILDVTNPHDREALRGEMIMDLVNQCHVNHKRVMRLIDMTADEITLKEALSLSDNLQRVLANYDAIASDSILSSEHIHSDVDESPHEAEKGAKIEDGVSSAKSLGSPSLNSGQHDQLMDRAKMVEASVPYEPVCPFVQLESTITANVPHNEKGIAVSDNEENDEFVQLARRTSRAVVISEGSCNTTRVTQVSPRRLDVLPSSDVGKTRLGVESVPLDVNIKDRRIDVIDYNSHEFHESQMQMVPVEQKTEHLGAEGLQPYLPPSRQQLNFWQMPTQSYVVPWALEDPQGRVSSTVVAPNQSSQGSSPHSSSSDQPVYPPPPWELKMPSSIPRLVPSHPLYRTKSSLYYPDINLTGSGDYADSDR